MKHTVTLTFLLTLLALLLNAPSAAAEEQHQSWLQNLRTTFSSDTDQEQDSRGLQRLTEPGLLAERPRIALVIGNGDYASGRLKNPANDARAMSAKLKELGFQVTTLIDAKRRAMDEAVRAFTRAAGKDDAVSLFYYAGHGLEVDGQNYLLPIDAHIETEADVPYESLAAGRLLDGLRVADNGLNLVILDACRNNPYSRGFRSSSQGLADMNPASGTLILYATEPGQVAADGDGNNGAFTEQLLAALDQSGLTVEQVFKKTALQVRQATGGRQTPWQEGVILGQFYFRPSALPPSPIQIPPPPPPPPLVDLGYLQINTKVPDTQVWVAGRDMGMIEPAQPLNFMQGLPTGEIEISAAAPGYIATQQTVMIQHGAWTQVILDLTPEIPVQNKLSGIEPGNLEAKQAMSTMSGYVVPGEISINASGQQCRRIASVGKTPQDSITVCKTGDGHWRKAVE